MSLPKALAGPCAPGIYIVHVHDRHAHMYMYVNLHVFTMSCVASTTGMAATLSFLAGGGPLSDMLSSRPDMMESRPRAPHTKSAGSLLAF